MSVESKIERLIEESMSKKTIKRLKAAGIAAAAGATGAGLDLYLTGGHHLADYAKPLLAWGAGGAVGGILQDPGSDKKDKKDNKDNKDKKVDKDGNTIEESDFNQGNPLKKVRGGFFNSAARQSENNRSKAAKKLIYLRSLGNTPSEKNLFKNHAQDVRKGLYKLHTDSPNNNPIPVKDQLNNLEDIPGGLRAKPYRENYPRKIGG